MSGVQMGAIHEKLRVLEAAQEAARDVFRRTVRNFYPDGLRVVVHAEFHFGHVVEGEGVIVGMELDSRLRVEVDGRAMVHVFSWHRLTPILPDQA